MVERDPDLRLLPVALGLWLGIGSGFAVGARSPVLVGLLLALVLTVWRLPEWRRPLLVATLLGCTLLGLRVWQRPSVSAIDGSHSFEFVVLGDAATRSAYGSLNFEREQSFLADVVSVDGQVVASTPVYVTVGSGSWPISTRGRCEGRVKNAEGLRRYVGYLRCRGPAEVILAQSRMQWIADQVRAAAQRVVAGLEPSAAAGLLPGLVLGDTSQVAATDAAAMKVAGLGHLTAVSGANVAIVLAGVAWLLTLTRLSRPVRLVIQAFAVAAFVVVVRPSPSVVRAAMMAWLGLSVAFAGGRKRGELLLLAATSVLLVLDPWLAVSFGFALSVAATAGLVLLAPRIWPSEAGWLRRAAATAIAASVATLPVLLAMGAQVTFASIPANILVEVFVAPATLSGVSAALLATVGGGFAPIWFVARLLAQIGVWCAAAVLWVARTAQQSWLAESVVSITGALCVVAFVLAMWRMRRWRSAAAFAVMPVLAFAPLSRIANPWPPRDWVLIACDVGQGDATLLKSPAGLVLVDAGPDPVALDGCLRRNGIDQIALFVATHFHADHVGGLAAISDKVRAWLPACGVEPQLGRTFAFAALQNVPEVDSVVDYDLQVLTCPTGNLGADSGSDINNSTQVLVFSSGSFRVLLTGDIEQLAQTTLMSAVAAGSFDVVKVPHHGSAAQADGFALWTGAASGWVSVAAVNDYGHPAASTLMKYRKAGVALLSTADCGDLALTSAGWVTARRCG